MTELPWPGYRQTDWGQTLKDYIDGNDQEITHALGQITVQVISYATPEQIAGTADARAAWQAAGDALAALGGGRLSGIGGNWWWSGSYVKVTPDPADPNAGPRWDHVHIDLTGCRMFKTSTAGSYVMFLDRFGAPQYGGGVNDFVIENGVIEGSFSSASPASVCLFVGNHSRRCRFRNIEFRQVSLQGAHTFELDGCDGVIIEDCRWYGYKPDGVNAPRTEAINTDCSQVGAGGPVAGYASGLACKNITVSRCSFLPWTDPASGTKWPCPPVMGTHGAREGQRHTNIKAVDILCIDPPVDDASTGVAGENSYLRGLIHYPGVNGLTVRMRVIATNGQGSIRCVQVQSWNRGKLAASDPNDPGADGDFATPNLAESVDLDVEVEGMASAITTLNPAVYVGGVTGGNARNVDIRVRSTNTAKEAVYLWRVEKATVRFPKCSGGTSGARVAYSDQVSVSGKFENVQIPARFQNNSQRCSVPDIQAINNTGSNYAFLIETPSGTDYITVGTAIAQGYNSLYSATPAHRAQGAVVGVTPPTNVP